MIVNALKMSGRWLLDAATLLKAARGVISKYTSLQRHQLDIYARTSSITKAVRHQTIQGTSKPGAGLTHAEPSVQDSNEHAPGKKAPVPSQATINDGRKQVQKRSGVEQDHLDTKSEANTAAQPLPDSELGVTQEKPKSQPLPDGSITPAKPDISVPKHDQNTFSEKTKSASEEGSLISIKNGTNTGFLPVLPGGTSIPDSEAKAKKHFSDRKRVLQRNSENQIPSVSAEPPNARLQPEATPQDSVADRHPIGLEQDVFHTRLSKATRVLSSLPRIKLPKVTGDTQGGDFHVTGDRINQDVFYSAPSGKQQQPVPEVQAVPEQEQSSDNMYSEIFHSPRVAKLLKEERKEGNPANALKPRAVHDTPVEQAKLSQAKDQESFNIRSTSQEPNRAIDHHTVTEEPAQFQKRDAEDDQNLAEAMAQGVASASPAKPEVSIEIHLSGEVLADKLTVIL